MHSPESRSWMKNTGSLSKSVATFEIEQRLIPSFEKATREIDLPFKRRQCINECELKFQISILPFAPIARRLRETIL